jgi:anaerobic magnesium-protoporphyrin IX monomethyl ester cyclase
MSTKSSSVLLLFPPVTEARLFPYLSTPALTAYLRQARVQVSQTDLNLELSLRLFSESSFSTYLQRVSTDSHTDLKSAYRAEMVQFLLAEQKNLVESVFSKRALPERSVDDALRFVRQGVELLLENSLLVRKLYSLQNMALIVAEDTDDSCFDLPRSLLKQLVLEIISQSPPQIVGLSIPFYSQILPSLLVAKWIKQISPETFIVLGGQQVMLRHDEIAKMPCIDRWVDALGTGQGEEALLWLHRVLSSNSSRAHVPDLVWLGPNQDIKRSEARTSMRLERLPTPDFSDLQLSRYLSDTVQIPLTTCIGCYWGRCCFCSYGNRSRKESNYQELSPEKIADHCTILIDSYAVNRINFVDENTNLKLVIRAVRILNKRGYQIEFSTRNRLEAVLLSESFCRELKERGCVLMSAGYETNSQRLLNLMDKGIRASRYQQIIDNLDAVGVPLRLSVLGGILDETPEEAQESLDFLKRNSGKIGIDVLQMLVAEPKTYLTDMPEAYGVAIDKKTELRGNEELNYGMGRMGQKVIYQDGDSFDRRLEDLKRFFYEITPQKNDEISPRKRFGASFTAKSKPGEERVQLKLHPWVRVVRLRLVHSQRPVLADLLWEQFYRIPETLSYDSTKSVLTALDDSHGPKLLYQFARVGMGRVVQAPEGV